MKQRKTNQAGRSMLEMLGVLAIVGILSVGGIFGYNKAVLKIKLNRQAEQYTQLITNIPLLLNQKELYQTNYVYLTSIMIKAGIIPQDMILKNSRFIYDTLGNQIDIAREGYFFTITITGANKIVDYNTCNNLLQLSKEMSPMLWQTHFIQQEETDDNLNYKPRIYGDNYCQKGLDCLKDLTPTQIIELCKNTCINQTSCYMRILWK